MKTWFWRLRGALACAVFLLAGCGGSDSPNWVPQATVKADTAAGAAFQGHGTYWNPQEPGTGFFFEAQGDNAIATFYMFETDGRSVWYSAYGPFVRMGSEFRFQGQLQRFWGGAGAAQAVSGKPTATVVGDVSIVFDGGKAQVQLPRRKFEAVRFFQGSEPLRGDMPETGIFWNPERNGSGFTIESNQGTVYLTLFTYDNAGEPIWQLAPIQQQLREGRTESLRTSYRGGQTLHGTHAAPKLEYSLSLGTEFSQPCEGILTFGASVSHIQRFAFGTSGDACRARSAAEALRASLVGAAFDVKHLPYPGSREGQLQQLMEQGASGYSFLGFAVDLYVQEPDAVFEVMELALPSSALAYEELLNAMARTGYRFRAIGARAGFPTFERRLPTSSRHAYRVTKSVQQSPDDFLAQLQAQGTEGYLLLEYTPLGNDTVQVWEKDLQHPGHYVYELLRKPVWTKGPGWQSIYRTQINAQGLRGFRPLTRTYVRSDTQAYVKDLNQPGAVFSYDLEDLVYGAPRQAQAAAQAASGGFPGPLLGLQFGSWSTYVRHAQCQGDFCRSK